MKLIVEKVREDAIMPQYAHPGDAGLDLFSVEERVLEPGESALISTGIRIALPPGTEGQVRPRSGLALKHQVTLLNAPGTIDEGYRGEIMVIVINHGKKSFKVSKQMKIAQMVITSYHRVEIQEGDVTRDTRRGEGGFGSTGV